MENSRNGDAKVTYEQALFGQRRNGAFPTYVDLVQEAVDADPARPLPPQSTGSRRRTHADGELDVFAAERYFKGAMDGDYKDAAAAVVVPEETAATAARPAVAVSKPAWTRASAASTGSRASANSQTVLLRDARRRLPGYRGKQCCLQLGVLLRSCSGKRAVGVDSGAATEAAGSGEPAASRIEWYRDLRIEKAALGLAGDGNHGMVAGRPPNLNLGTAKVAAIGGEAIREETAAEYTSASFRRSFTLLAPVKVSVPVNCGGGGVDAGVGRGGGNGDDDDVGSESSSDLFEIKSLMIDDCPYEPSEASIQWSVVTASAGDVSVASERGGRAGSAAGSFRPGPMAVTQHRDRPVGLLTGCVSHRAVDVSAMPAVRRFPPAPAAVAMRRRSDGFQKAQTGPS